VVTLWHGQLSHGADHRDWAHPEPTYLRSSVEKLDFQDALHARQFTLQVKDHLHDTVSGFRRR
jgi:hypothetical protein